MTDQCLADERMEEIAMRAQRLLTGAQGLGHFVEFRGGCLERKGSVRIHRDRRHLRGFVGLSILLGLRLCFCFWGVERRTRA